MLTAARFKQHCAQLVDPKITPEQRKELATEVRDSIELVHSQDYGDFLTYFLPTFKTVLSVLTRPQFVDNSTHQIRATILEILNRLPLNDVMRSKFLDLYAICMEILQHDNEDNAVTAIHIIFDLYKNYRGHLGGQVQSYLNFCRSVYESFAETVNALLLTKKPAEHVAQGTPRRMNKSIQSFKVITECPLLVMFVFQLYPAFIKTNINPLLSLMLRAIEVDVSPQAISEAPKAQFQEFIACQVKTVSFLSYLLKQFPDLHKPDEMSIPRSTVKLLQSCPAESAVIRKELLVATRHILGTPFRQGFYNQIDLLLEPKVLIGSGRGATDSLRPLAYSFLAELVHCVRLNLTIPQLEKIIAIFSTNLHDPTFSYSLQTSSVRLLLNLIEGIPKVDDGEGPKGTAARELLLRILETMVEKYVTLGAQIPRLLQSAQDLRAKADQVGLGKRLCEVPVGDPMKDISDFKALLKTLTLGLKTLIWSAINIRASQGGPKASPMPTNTAENAANGSTGNSTTTTRSGQRAGLFEKESEIVSRLLAAGQNCFRLYSQNEEANRPLVQVQAAASTNFKVQEGSDVVSEVGRETDPFTSHSTTSGLIVASAQEEKEMFDQFAQIFTVLDVRSFQDVFGLRMDDLFNHIVNNPGALMIPQHFLANSNISKYFADILLNFLVENLSILDVAWPSVVSSREEKRAQSLLKLFRILFASVTLFSTNEPVLRRHINLIVRTCLSHAERARDPHNYLQMLRALFKTLTNNKAENNFEALYRDFVPLVEPLFRSLLNLYKGPTRQLYGELIVELCLMIPARPSTVFPYLELQMKPIVWALQGSREIMQYGLRSLEFWVDMLQPSYLETVIEQVEPDLTQALYRLLRPPHSVTFGASALRVLGKLGARARRNTPLKMPFRTSLQSKSSHQFSLTWPNGSTIPLSTDSLIRLSANALLGRRKVGSGFASTEHKVQAWKFLYSCLSMFLATGRFTDILEGLDDHEHRVWALSNVASSIDQDTAEITSSKNKQHHRSTFELVKMLLVSLVAASGSAELHKSFRADESSYWSIRTLKEHVLLLSRYFGLMAVQDSERYIRSKSTEARSVELLRDHGSFDLGLKTYVEAITEVLSLEDRSFSNGGLDSMKEFVSAVLEFSASGRSEGTQTLINRKQKVDVGSASGITKNLNGAGLHPDKKPNTPPSGSLQNASNASQGKEKKERTDSAKGASSVSVSDQSIQKDVDMIDIGVSDQKSSQPAQVDDDRITFTSLSTLIDSICHCCYQRSWNTKWAGAKGLRAIINIVPEEKFSSPLLVSINIQMIRALLFVVRDSPQDLESDIAEHGRQTLQKLLCACFARRAKNPSTKSMLPTVPSLAKETTIRLTIDLVCDSPTARETARQCLQVFAKTVGCEVSDLLSPVKEHLLRPLQQRPLRQHPFPVQIGYIEAIIFCLQLEKPVLATELFSKSLRDLVLSEVIAISEDSTLEKLTEAEEGIRHKLVENKVIETSVVKHLMRLRRQVVELLCTVTIKCGNYLQEQTNDDLFRRMISSFFKNLQSRDEDIVRSAKRGLKQAISKHQKPKELLQLNLRPILGNLADYKKLSIPYLQGLSRVLELFSNWFNVSLGEKLLEHLQRWTEPEKLSQLKRWAPGTEAKVGAAILDLFHLLPPPASKFLDKIVLMVIRLESVLTVAGPGVAHLGLKSAKASSTSLYRAPLLKYCNQHAGAAVRYFLLNLDNELMRQLFFVMIKAKESHALRKELTDNPKRLVSPAYLSVEGMGGKSLHTITLIDLLSRHNPEWLGSDPDLMQKLSTYWKAVSSFSEVHQISSTSRGRVLEIKTIAEVFTRYCSNFQKEINILFELLPVFSTRTSCDFTFVRDMLERSVKKKGNYASRKAIIVTFLSFFRDKSVSQERKVHALQFIVIPMIEFHLSERKEQQERLSAIQKEQMETRGGKAGVEHEDDGKRSASDLVNPSSDNRAGRSARSAPLNVVKTKADGQKESSGNVTASTDSRSNSAADRAGIGKEGEVGKDALKTLSPDTVLDSAMIQRIMKELLDQPDEVLRSYDEPLSAELLRLATVLMQYMPIELGRYRKELIKFGWNHLKREECIAKQWAFVNVSRFFEAYQAPVKIILQVYVALLRACQGEGKDLVQKALDILTPALPRRLLHNPSEHKYPIWIRYTKKILLEEGHSIPNLVHILQLISRHSSLFYVARAQFVPIMVNSLSRIGLNPNSNAENRRLALDLVDLVITWERKRLGMSDEDKNSHAHGQSGDSENRKRGRDESTKTDVQKPDPGENKGNEGQFQKTEAPLEPPAKTRKNSDSQAIPVASSPGRPASSNSKESEDFKPTAAMVDVIVSFLVQVPFRQMDRREGNLIRKKCIILLKEALQLWPEATGKLGFMEKLLALPPGEKISTTTLPKAVAFVANSDNSAPDGKGSARNDNQRTEKAENARMKRHVIRHVVLRTGMSLVAVFTKIQGMRFVKGNVTSIRAMVTPAITEGNISAAAEFATMLSDLLHTCPQMRSLDQSSAHGIPDSKGNTVANTTVGNPASTDAHMKPGNAAGGSSTLSDQIFSIYKAVHEAVQYCMKAQDVVANHCGLVVLKTLSNSVPQDFVKYQEYIARSLPRIARESLNAAQQRTAAGNAAPNAPSAANGNHRSGNNGDRVSITGAVQSSNRTGAASISGGDGNQTPETRVGKSQSPESASVKSSETKALILCISLLGDNILTLEPSQRKTFFQLLWSLIDKCVQVDVLLEIVRVVGKWVLWKPSEDKKVGDKNSQISGQKEPLSSKEKVQFLIKMVVFERISGDGAKRLMNAYLNVILKVSGGEARRPELLSKLERAFMLGMKCQDSSMRQQFFQIYDASISPALPFRLGYVLAKQEWECLADTLWIKHAVELIISAAEKKKALHCDSSCSAFPALVRDGSLKGPSSELMQDVSGAWKMRRDNGDSIIIDESLQRFCDMHANTDIETILTPLRRLLHHDPEMAYQTWIDLLPKIWNILSAADRGTMERSLPVLLTKEYHQVQAAWPRNNIQALLDSIVRCEPLPVIRPDLIFHLGSRWNSWHTSILYLEKRSACLRIKGKGSMTDDKISVKVNAELEDAADALSGLYRQLHERDYLAGLWKQRAQFEVTKKAITLEQLGQYARAQEIYTSAVRSRITRGDSKNVFDKLERNGRAEICFWEERWIACSRSLCQWDTLTEFSRVVVNSELLQDCLWRVPDWSALKELLIKNPVEDGPQLKLYQAYVQLQENKLEGADSFITQGYQRTLERYAALPETADLDAARPVLVQFQQLVELQESGRILGELNALSRHGSGSINVGQKIDNVRQILNTWRERLPSPHESLIVWNDVLTWRNHVHAVVVNVLEALKEAASAKVAAAQSSSTGGPGSNRNGNGLTAQNPQVQAAAAIAQALPQQVLVMGVNETAWNVHRYAKACRKQGFPDMALFALQKLYPFGTMELNEYFVKTKETARSYMSRPKGVDNGTKFGLHELNRCNMDHFNARQKAQLFTVRGNLCADLGQEEEAVEAYSIALSTSSDVGSAWLAWGHYCDQLQGKLLHTFNPYENVGVSGPYKDTSISADSLQVGLEWREATVNCILQAAKFGSRKARMHLSRVLRLLTLDVQNRVEIQSVDKGKASSAGMPSEHSHSGGGNKPRVSTSNQDGNVSSELTSSQAATGAQSKEMESGHKDKSISVSGGVAKVISTLLLDIPPWMWLPWVHQIVLMLGRKEGSIVKPILVRIAQQYPQAVFFPVRSYMEERKPIDRPEKHLTKEAMKLNRPITTAFLPAASTTQVTTLRQLQVAKDNVQRTQNRYVLIQKALQRNEAAITSSQVLQDQSASLTKKNQLKAELLNAHRMLQRYLQEYKAAEQRHRQNVENAASGQVSGATGQPTSLKKQSDDGNQSQGALPMSDGQSAEASESTSKQRMSNGSASSVESPNDPIGKNQSSANTEKAVEMESDKGSTASNTPFGHADWVMALVVKSNHSLYMDLERLALELSFRLKPQREEHLLSLMNALLHRCCQSSVKPGKEVAPSFRSALEEVSRMCFGTGTDQRDKVTEQRNLGSIADLKEAFEAELAPQTAKDFPTLIEPFIARLRRWQTIFQRRVEAMPDCLKLENLSRHMIEIRSSDVEVFGQYHNADLVSEPNIEKHVTIERFSADVRVVRRQTGPARGVCVLGSDGKKYDFVLENSVNSNAHASEERISQVHRLVNCHIFAKNSQAHQRRIQLNAPIFIATGARTRLVSDDPGMVSLADGLEEYLESQGNAFDDPLMSFRQMASEAFARRRAGISENNSRAESIAARVEAYHSVCETLIPDTCLLDFVRSRMPTSSSEFIFRKRLAETLGPASIVSYSLAIGARRPQNILFSWTNGNIHNLHMRSLVSGRGIIESDEAVPFRFTRNLVRLLGQVGTGGPFYGAMATALRALLINDDLLRRFLDFVLRDELVTWINAKSDIGRGRSSTDEELKRSLSNAKIVDRCLAVSVNAVLKRLSYSSNSQGHQDEKGCDDLDIENRVNALIGKASKPENLAQMDSSWQAWY